MISWAAKPGCWCSIALHSWACGTGEAVQQQLLQLR